MSSSILAKHGWVIIDKPKDISSAMVVSKIKRTLNIKKVGHAGTLDPLASGILPIALGNATKTTRFLQEKNKAYLFEITWGVAKDTDDAEGEVINTSSKIPTPLEIDNITKSFVGVIEQKPPIYSAIKINGKRAYSLARKGQRPVIASRKVQIYRFERIQQKSTINTTFFSVTCGKGTYVRSLARDLAIKLGTFGYVSSLRRTSYGPFDENMAISLDKIVSLVHKTGCLGEIYPISIVLDDIPAIEITDRQAKSILQGQAISISDLKDYPEIKISSEGVTFKIICGDVVIALAMINELKLKPFRVLQTD
jgi:tRNA pseudouridine55 synthase